DCSAPDATSAGGHFNPTASAHGRVGEGEHHAGDSDNIAADDQGVATVDSLLRGATLGDGSPSDIVGKAVIVHADPDDYTTQPTGNAGARLAGGAVEARQAPTAPTPSALDPAPRVRGEAGRGHPHRHTGPGYTPRPSTSAAASTYTTSMPCAPSTAASCRCRVSKRANICRRRAWSPSSGRYRARQAVGANIAMRTVP